MARIIEPTQEEEAAWREWVESRPAKVRAIAKLFEPWSLYRMKSTGQRVTVQAFAEDGTLRVNVSGDYNLVAFERDIFGVDPSDLEPCDLPTPDEHVGALLSDEQFEENIDAIRVAVRPDLFEMGADGKARRKS